MAGYLGTVHGCTVNVVLGLYLLMQSVTGLNIFTTTGWPACYIARSQIQSVPGLFNRCHYGGLSLMARYTDSNGYYIYCSIDQDCCYHDGYPACCTTKTEFKEKEVFGLVIGCVIFVFIILGVALCVANKHCRTDVKDEL